MNTPEHKWYGALSALWLIVLLGLLDCRASTIIFDGVNDQVIVGSQSQLKITGNTATWEAWIKPAALPPSVGMIMNKEGEYEFALVDNGNLWWAIANSSPGWVFIDSGAAAPLNEWTHVAFVYTGANMMLYTNGVLASTQSASGTIGDAVTSLNDFRIGVRQSGPGSFFNGQIDEVRVWNVARSGAEVAEWMSKPLTGDEPGLIAYYPFNEGAGPYTLDGTKNSLAGTLTSGPVWNPSFDAVDVPISDQFLKVAVDGTNAAIDGTINLNRSTPTNHFQWGPGSTALAFDGVNDRVTVPHQADLNAFPLTVTAWVKVAPGAATSGLVDKYVGGSGNGWRVIVANGRIHANYFRSLSQYIGSAAGSNLWGPRIDDDDWHHIAFTVSTNGGALYVDGAVTARGNWVGAPAAPTTTETLKFGHGAGAYTAARIDDVAIWNTALDASDIADLIAAGQTIGHAKYASIVGHWDFEDGAGGTAADVTGNGHDGTLEGPVWRPEARPIFINQTPPQLVSGTNSFLQLDGRSGYARVDDTIDLANVSFSCEFRARSLNGPFNVGIFQGTSSQNNGLHIGLRPNGAFTFAFYVNDLNTPQLYTDADWHHWACTYDVATGERKIYRDGVVVARDTAAASFQGGGPTYFGRYPPTANFFRGDLDDVRIWRNAVLSADTIRNWMNVPVTPSHPNYANLQGNWRFDEPGGTNVLDSGPLGKNGVLFGDAVRRRREQTSTALSGLASGSVYHVRSLAVSSNTVSPSRAGQFATPTPGGGTSLRFDGRDDHVIGAPANLPIGNSPYTIEAWIKPDEAGNLGIVGWGNYGANHQANALRMYSGGIVNYWWNNDLPAPVGPLTDGWHHVAATFDGTLRNIYLDGVLVASAPASSHNVPSAANFAIGKTYNTEFFKGSMDDVRIWDLALTRDEIQENMNVELTGNEPGLVAYYRMDEGGGVVLVDETAYQNDGLLLNEPFRESSHAPVKIPLAVTLAASSVSEGNATLNGTVNGDGVLESRYWFEYGTGGSFTFSTAELTLAPGAGPVAVTASLTSLQGGQLHQQRLVAANANGTNYGAVRTFYMPYPASGFALEFHGTNHVNFGDSTELKASVALTVEAWIHPTGPGSDSTFGGIIVNKEGEYEFARFADGTLRWAMNITSPKWTWVNSGIAAPLDEWMHVAFTYDRSAVRLYTNGVLAKTMSASGTITDFNASLNELWVGGRQGGGQAFQGMIDEVRVWEVTRSASDVAGNYNKLLTGNEPGLLLYAQFDEGDGTTTVDRGPNQFAGTLVNSPAFVRSGAKPTGPLVTTLPPAPVLATTATLHGTVNPSGDTTIAAFQYGPTIAYGSSVQVTNVLNGLGTSTLSATLTNLEPGTTYHYRMVAQNAFTTNYGANQTFNTLVLGCGWPISTKITGGESLAPCHVVDAEGNTYVAGLFSGTASFVNSLTAIGDEYNAFVGRISRGGDWTSAVQIPVETNGTTKINAIAVDPARNIYVAGQFSGTNTFGSTELVSNGDTNLFVAKLDSTGTNWLWAIATGGTGVDAVHAMTIVGTNIVFVAGQYSGNADFSVTNLNSTGGSDVFAAKLDAEGNWVWARSGGGTGASDAAYAIATDSRTNVYLAGQFQNTASFGAFTLTNAGGTDLFVSKLSPTGVWVQARRGGSANNDAATGLASDGNQIYLVGQFGGIATYGISLNNQNLDDTTNTFVMKLNTEANVTWYAQGGSGVARGVAVDANGRVYVSGDFSFTTKFGGLPFLSSAGNRDVFLARLDALTGNWLWSRRVGSSGTELGGSVGMDGSGSVVFSGSYQNTIEVGYVALTTPNNQDIFVARIDAEQVYEHNNWEIGQAIPVPAEALDPARTDGGAIGMPSITILEKDQADSDEFNSFVWGLAEKKLYPVRKVTAILKWPLTSDVTNTTSVATCVGRTFWPSNPRIHVANTPAELEPDVPGFPLRYLDLSFTTINGASVDPGEKLFTATQPGWSVIQLLDTGGASPDPNVHPSRFEVVRTISWNDPQYLLDNVPATIGAALTHPTHDDPAGRNGYVYFENAFYDGAGDERAYNRVQREGPIIPVNKDTTATNDDLVVVWYLTGPNGIAWPGTPVRYLAEWPPDADPLVIASRLGSGLLSLVNYPSKRVYNQPDRTLPGYNPNEEHAALYGDTLFALRNDLNNVISPRASEPFVLLKYLDPGSGAWAMKVYQVVLTNSAFPLSYPGLAGDPLLLPEPLTFLNLCGTSNRIVSGPGYQDYAGRLYARAAGPDGSGTNVVARYWYPLQPGFFYDLNLDGTPDAASGDCIPWLDRRPGGVAGTPVNVNYNITWPTAVPTLQIGETLFSSRLDGANLSLPDIRHFADARVIFDQGNPFDTNSPASLVRLYDPLTERALRLADDFSLPGEVITANDAGRLAFTDLPYAIRARLHYDELNKVLSFGGLLDESADYGGPQNPLLLINVLSPRERDRIKALSSDPEFRQAVDELYDLTRNPNRLDADRDSEPDKALLIGLANTYTTNQTTGVITTNIAPEQLGDIPKVLTAGPGTGSGYITVVENDSAFLGGLPVILHILRVAGGPYLGDLKVLASDNVFDEKLTLRHSADFGGEPQNFEFEWYYQPDEAGFDRTDLPVVDANGVITDDRGWLTFPGVPAGVNGYNDITIGDGGQAGLLTLSDNWFICRYRGYTIGAQTNVWSDWVGVIGGGEAQKADGWVKRVVLGLGPFETRSDDFHLNETVTFASMLQQAGTRYEGDIAFNIAGDNINSIGLIEAYETVLRRARRLSIDANPGINFPPANNALLLAAGRIADFYMLLGNEAFSDAADPTIGFQTGGTEYGTLAPSIFTFQNQLGSLLDEELALLRGRDNSSATVRSAPAYNRLFWNFTHGEGEVAYAQAYNITDQNNDGFIDATDAQIMYPQGHGDAWGHYLTATKTYYALLQNTNFDWVARSESISLAGVPVEVDYLDERKFARAAAAKAKAGAEIVDLSYRLNYVDDPEGQWQGYKDTDPDRAWGLSEWGHRTGSAAFFDWVTANAILPATDPDTNHTGLTKIDRTTVEEIREIQAAYQTAQEQVDKADLGLNPLGLVKNVVPFDIDPSQISAGKTHFEQIYDRAIEAVNNTLTVFNHANQLSQALRRLQDNVNDFSQNVEDQERDYKNRLIEIFGYPHAGDIGTGRTYPPGYNGPDLYHYMYIDTTEVNGETAPAAPAFTAYFNPLSTSVTNITQFFPDDLAGVQGALTQNVLPINYPQVAADYAFVPPASWGERQAPGELQIALSTVLQKEAALKRGLENYDALIAKIGDAIDLLEARYDLEAEQIRVNNVRSTVDASAGVVRLAGVAAERFGRKGAFISRRLGDIAAEGFPKVLGLSSDVTSAGRVGVLLASEAAAKPFESLEFIGAAAGEAANAAREITQAVTEEQLRVATVDFELQQRVKELEALMREEAPLRLEIFELREAVNQAGQEYLATLSRGLRLIDERVAFRKNAAAETQASRYQDMTFRVFRNDAIQKYRAQFDLAARYVFLAAVAYDFETQLLGGKTGAGREFLTDIIRQRALGQVENGVPIAGRHGLADPLARLSQNFNVLKGQLGFNNPQTETGQFSLRSGLFRMKNSSDEAWRAELRKHIVPDLWQVPEFRRYCRPFAPESAGPQPGLIIRFPTTVTFGLNYFGWPLGGGDSAYDSTLFATKVRSAGVWFSDYNGSGLSLTPRIYLVPAGADIMRSPSGKNLETREWRVVDQKIPVPFPIGFSSLNDEAWIPMNDSLSDTFGDIRRFSSFRAYHDSGVFDPAQTISDSRLIGRSVWNTDWMLIIPGGTFLFDPDEGLDTFIDSVSDIKIFFQTYAYSGN